MSWRRRAALASSIGVLAITMLASGSGPTLAYYTDPATASGTFTSDTLAPPTALEATGGSGVGLTWTPTVDTYATGYSLWRGTVSGGPYSQAGSVAPGTSTSTTDSPTAGTWYYVLRSSFGAWSSVDSNEASATVDGATSTAFVGCASEAADTSAAGDNDGYQNTPLEACTDGGAFAQDAASGNGGSASCGTGVVPDPAKDRHQFWGFATGLPGTVSAIGGIEVRADLGLNNNGGTTNLCAQLSWDGGATWTTIKSLAVSGIAQSTYVFGATTDTWGRSWTPAELASGTFRVRIIDASTQTNKRYELDYLAVSVTYTP
jgi:predicted ribosomally synthesized peptide with SipW-like signal peptide